MNEDLPIPPPSLTVETLQTGVDELAARDTDLRAVVERFGPPPLWERPAGFGTLVHIVLEQQVSLASAQAAFDRLNARLDPLTPGAFLELDDGTLLAIGFSRQKARYVRALATALLDRTLDLAAIGDLDDDAADAALVAVPGIGPWTSTIYRLMVLRRPDAWPAGDIALAQSLAEVKAFPARPSPEDMRTIADPWRPWRAVAARILWHGYLSTRAEGRERRESRGAGARRPPPPPPDSALVDQRRQRREVTAAVPPKTTSPIDVVDIRAR